MLNVCSPTWLTQPPMTWPTASGSMPARSTAACCTAPRRSAGCTVASPPLRRPSGDRTASTITTSLSASSATFTLLVSGDAAMRTAGCQQSVSVREIAVRGRAVPRLLFVVRARRVRRRRRRRGCLDVCTDGDIDVDDHDGERTTTTAAGDARPCRRLRPCPPPVRRHAGCHHEPDRRPTSAHLQNVDSSRAVTAPTRHLHVRRTGSDAPGYRVEYQPGPFIRDPSGKPSHGRRQRVSRRALRTGERLRLRHGPATYTGPNRLPATGALYVKEVVRDRRLRVGHELGDRRRPEAGRSRSRRPGTGARAPSRSNCA